MKTMLVGLRAAAGLLAAAAVLGAEDTEFFEKRIRPLLAEKCYACHSGKLKEPMGGLRLDTAGGLRQAVEGKLLKAISYTDLKLRMPPDGRLPPQAINDLGRWVEMGAPHALGEAPSEARRGIDFAEARRFWAFQPVRLPPIPKVKDRGWPSSPIDYFLLARLEAGGRRPAPSADRRSWIRRVTFDLTGLPPAPSEIDSFLQDSSPRAFENVVERLLASPHYGERWARHWLDLVRFAETNGHEFDNDKLDAWRYRDYVIRAFNGDLPYNHFVREHVAGDMLASPSRWEAPVASGFFWFGEVLNSATDSVKSRADTVDNQIDVLSKTFLGLTVACARCHDHKFDPIPTADYYALAGILHSTEIREAVIDSAERQQEIREAAHLVVERGGKVTAQEARIKLRDGDELFEDFSDYSGWRVSGQAFGDEPRGVANSLWVGSNRFVGSLTSRKFKMPKLWVHVRMRGAEAPKGLQEKTPLRVTVVADDHKSAHILATGGDAWEWRSARMTKEIGRTCYFEIVDRDRNGHLAVDAIVLSDHRTPPEVEEPGAWSARIVDEVDVPESVFAMTSRDDAPHNVRLHIRGSHTNLGEEVPRGFLQVLAGGEQNAVTEGSGRRMLADWLASERNPLAARVMVNRIWQHHFGRGLVGTVDNFGHTGERPADPELLDYLAARFVESGWSVKAMHRLMVLSSAYRTASRAASGAEWVFPVRRLEAEAIRDAILAVSGALDPALYGPGVTPHISKYQDGRGKPPSGPLDGNGRRSIYIQVRRNFLTPMFLAFDYPLPASTTGMRGNSTVPSQALLMMNNEFVAAMARNWAARLIEREPDPGRRLELAWVSAYGRPPEPQEKDQALSFLARHSQPGDKAWADLCHVLFNSAEFLYVR